MLNFSNSLIYFSFCVCYGKYASVCPFNLKSCYIADFIPIFTFYILNKQTKKNCKNAHILI